MLFIVYFCLVYLDVVQIILFNINDYSKYSMMSYFPVIVSPLFGLVSIMMDLKLNNQIAFSTCDKNHKFRYYYI